jgi:plasmid maintenance system killer protein
VGERRGQFSIRINVQWRVCFQLDGCRSVPRRSR